VTIELASGATVVRHQVVHEFCGRQSDMQPQQAQDMARDPASWCAVCGRRLPVEQFRWTNGERVGP
jgi:hypothetical protein